MFVILNILWVLVFISCSDYRSNLSEVEKLLETNPQAADSILSSIPMPKSRRDKALYAVLKTQTDYKLDRFFTTDSLILTATDFYGSRRKSYYAALAWYSQGCVYSRMNNDYTAIYSFLKAKDLFPDTLVGYYALTEKGLGACYFRKKMFDEAFEEFSNCRINSERLKDSLTLYYSTFFSVLSKTDESNARNVDSLYSIIMQNATIYNSTVDTIVDVPMYVTPSFESQRDTSLRTVRVIKYFNAAKKNDPIPIGSYYHIKSNMFYNMGDYDSAYIYYIKSIHSVSSMKAMEDIIDRLADISAKKGKTDEVIMWHQRYIELRDSIDMVEKSDSKEIKDLQYLHREELKEEKMQNRHKRFVFLCVFSLITITIMTVLIYVLFMNREKKRIIEKQEELIKLEQEIRKSSISILESQVREQSKTDPEARAVLLDLYQQRIEINKSFFYKSDASKMLTSASFGQKFDSDCKHTIIETLKQSFSDTIADLQIEYPGIDTEESLTLILSAMRIKNELVSELLGNVTADAIRKRKYRFSKKNPDYYSLFC